MLASTLVWTLAYQPHQNQAVCYHSHSIGERSGAFSHCDIATGACVAGMWRADNARELGSELGLPEEAPSEQIILEAWKEWGTQLAQSLCGPFALALFDPKRKQVYLARDGLGVEPLFVARGPAGICASSCPRSGRRSAQLSSTPDAAMVADFVRGEISNAFATFHNGLTRVPPGRWMLIDQDGQQSERYWSVENSPITSPESNPVDTFRNMLAREISLSGGHDDSLAVLLSGGLDSSAVAALVADMRTNTADVTTLSLTYEGNPGWVDRPYIAAMRDALTMEHHSLPSQAHDPFADMDELLDALDGPSFGYGISVSTSLFAYAKTHGLKTVLHGHGGDEIVSHGIGRLNELAKVGEWLTLWRETVGAAALTGQSRFRVFERYLVHRPKWRWLKMKLTRTAKKSGAGVETPITAPGLPAASASTDLDPRPISARPEHTERDVQVAALNNPIQPHALETIMLTGRFHGLKIGMPFMSRELAEFSISLPSIWKLRGGYTRYVLREAMRPLAPSFVANRRNKNDFTQDFIDGLVSSPFARQYADPDNQQLTQYVNRQWLIENWAKVEREGTNISTQTARGLWRAAVLGRWLAMDRDAGILEPEKG
ncbi:MAG: asparagine synthase-related protein [Pseudomonadota bacterium]